MKISNLKLLEFGILNAANMLLQCPQRVVHSVPLPLYTHYVKASKGLHLLPMLALRRPVFELSCGLISFSARAGKASNKGSKVVEDEKGQKPVLVNKRQIQTLDKLKMGGCSGGEIHLIVGPMFAGKTTALIQAMQTQIQKGRRVVLVKSDKDTRYGLNSVVSHDGVKMPCWVAADLASFKVKLGEEAYKKLDVIGIDEAQFFKDLYSFCQVAADRDGKILIVAGLDGDYLRKSFGLTLELIPLADSVTKLKSRCEMCGKPASFTLRKTGERKTEIIGGADVYMPVCRQHYVNGQIVVNATRTLLGSQQVSNDVQVAKLSR